MVTPYLKPHDIYWWDVVCLSNIVSFRSLRFRSSQLTRRSFFASSCKPVSSYPAYSGYIHHELWIYFHGRIDPGSDPVMPGLVMNRPQQSFSRPWSSPHLPNQSLNMCLYFRNRRYCWNIENDWTCKRTSLSYTINSSICKLNLSSFASSSFDWYSLAPPCYDAVEFGPIELYFYFSSPACVAT